MGSEVGSTSMSLGRHQPICRFRRCLGRIVFPENSGLTGSDTRGRPNLTREHARPSAHSTVAIRYTAKQARPGEGAYPSVRATTPGATAREHARIRTRQGTTTDIENTHNCERYRRSRATLCSKKLRRIFDQIFTQQNNRNSNPSFVRTASAGAIGAAMSIRCVAQYSISPARDEAR
jgi:hypothetical protein